MDTRTYSNVRTLVSWEGVQSLDDCTLSILPTSVWRIMVKLWEDRGGWRTTYYTSLAGNKQTLPARSDFVLWLDDAREGIMSCNLVDLLARLDQIVAAITAGNSTAAACCAGSGSFVSDGAGGAFYGTQEPIAPPTTFGGTGEWTTEADYRDHLCLFANNLVSGLVVTTNNLSILTAISLFAGTAIVSFFVASPPVALLLALLLAEFAHDAFGDIAAGLEGNRQDIVCAIYNATGIAGIITAIEDWISTILATLGLSAWEQQVQELYRAMLNTDTLNQAYAVVGLPPVSGYVNCDGCNTLGWYASPSFPDTTIYVDNNYVQITSEVDLGGTDRYAMGVVYGYGSDGPYRQFTLSTPPYNVSGNTGVGAYAECDGIPVYPETWPETAIIAVSILGATAQGTYGFNFADGSDCP